MEVPVEMKMTSLICHDMAEVQGTEDGAEMAKMVLGFDGGYVYDKFSFHFQVLQA